eukprot:scpid98607/ scgid7089/ 
MMSKKKSETTVATGPDFAAEASQVEPSPVSSRNKERRRLSQTENSEDADAGCSPSDGDDCSPAKRKKESQFNAGPSSKEADQYNSKPSPIVISSDSASSADETSTQLASDPQPAELNAKLHDRLKNLLCYVSNRYYVPTAWKTPSPTRPGLEGKPGDVLDFVKIFDLTKPENYSKYVNSLCKRIRPTSSRPSHPRSEHLEARRRSSSKELDISGTNFQFNDHVQPLTDSCELAKNGDLRVIFTPSKGRHATELLQWSCPPCPDTLQVLLVPREEHD